MVNIMAAMCCVEQLNFFVVTLLVVTARGVLCDSDDLLQSTGQKFRLEGKVLAQQTTEKDWTANARVLVDGGQYIGILKSDGSFIISNIPSGSYVVEVMHPTYFYEPARVEINSKGKIRARSLNHVQPSDIRALNYPLRFKARGKLNYFEKREQWRLTDFIFSPMVLMMFLPLMLMMVLPKLMSAQDPETQREMQQQMNILQPQQNLPDMAEMMTKWFGSGTDAKKAIKNKSSKKKD